jgi:hypothetical protein
VWRAEVVDVGHASPQAFAMPARSASRGDETKPVAMPPGESWSGVYTNYQHESLHLVQSGTHVRGRWGFPKPSGSRGPTVPYEESICVVTPDAPECMAASKWGELDGTVTGGVLRFAWTAHTADGRVEGGRGRLVYEATPEPRLLGEYTIGGSDEALRWMWTKHKGEVEALP